MDVPRNLMRGYEIMAADAFDALPEKPTHVLLQNGWAAGYPAGGPTPAGGEIETMQAGPVWQIPKHHGNSGMTVPDGRCPR